MLDGSDRTGDGERTRRGVVGRMVPVRTSGGTTASRPRRRVFAVVAGLVATALLLAGCSSGGSKDPLQASPSLAAATPAKAPPPGKKPAGTVIPVAGDITSATVDPRTGTLAVAVSSPPSLLLYATDDLDNPKPRARTVPLPGKAGDVSVGEHGLLVPVPSANTLVRVSLPDATVHKVTVPGSPTDAVSFHGDTVVALPQEQSVVLLDGDRVRKTIHGSAIHPDRVLVAGDRLVVLDRLRSALFDVDVAGADFGAGLRAGQGATNAVADNFGRALVVDTRRDALLAFSVDPVTRRQLFPVPGDPYGIAYDPKRHLAWITATASNQVIAYDVARGEPVEKRRVPTVRQPDTVTVDPRSGAVIVASAAGKGIQVVQP